MTKSDLPGRVGKGDAAMFSGAVLRVGRLFSASVNDEPYGFKPRDAIVALRNLHDQRDRFRDTARAAMKSIAGVELLTLEEATALMGFAPDLPSRAPTLVPIYLFQEDVVRFRGFLIRVQVAVTVCERPGDIIAKSKAWVRFKRIIETGAADGDMDELRRFREAAIELATAIIEHQVEIYQEALRPVVQPAEQKSFRVEPSGALFCVLGLPSDELEDFGALFDEVAKAPLRDVATRAWGQKKDARALWNLLDLLPGDPRKALENDKRAAELKKGGKDIEVLKFQNSESYRGVFLWQYDRKVARLDVVGFAAPPQFELDESEEKSKLYYNAVNNVTAGLAADVGQSL